MQDMDVRNWVSGTRIFDDHVIDFLVLAFMEADSEVRLGQGAKVVADFGVLCRHVDEYGAERQFSDKLVLVGFQHVHEAKVLGRDFSVEVALQYGVRHLVAEDDDSATTGAKQAFGTAFDVLDDAFVAFVENDQNGVKSL